MITINDLIFVLAFVSAIGSGLIAGAFFAFSSFVMRALGRLPSEQGIAAMQSINIVVINPVFLGVFVGAALTSAVVVILSLVRWSDSGSAYLLAAGLVYILGTFLVTMVFNVPLNDTLASMNPATSEGIALWANYLTNWTIWNHVRTFAALIALALFIVGLVNRNT